MIPNRNRGEVDTDSETLLLSFSYKVRARLLGADWRDDAQAIDAWLCARVGSLRERQKRREVGVVAVGSAVGAKVERGFTQPSRSSLSWGKNRRLRKRFFFFPQQFGY